MDNDQKKQQTISGTPVKALYTPEDLACFDYNVKLGKAGAYPFTRGISPEMYRQNLWVMGQYSGFSTPEEANRRYRYLIEQGQTGFSIALDLPTQMGYDSDHYMAEGEVGKVGVSINSLEDVEALFAGIDLRKVRQIRTTANANSLILMAMFIVFAEKNKVDPKDIRFLLQNDILKEYFCRGTFIFPPRAGVKLAVDVIEYCAKNLPGWTPLAVCGYHIRDGGATAAQEIAFAMADAICYLDAAARRGLAIDSFAPSLYFFLASHVDLLEEVAKFRAARRVWARILKERYRSWNENSQKMSIFIMTMGGALTAEQPLNNIARVTIETLAAVLGGVQTIATSSYDEALSIPTEESVTVALRTQQIIAYEAGVTQTADPLGGSYYVECLTDSIEEEVFKYIEKIDKMGDAITAIETGFYQRELADAAYRYQKSVD
ncbi:MAG: methylmalonyl-CoA mutase family protein, partial [Acidaminococcales bacterium]|nr:methylmalonyl-CoA mutase family protein [Acidaminococcales bacterium]